MAVPAVTASPSSTSGRYWSAGSTSSRRRAATARPATTRSCFGGIAASGRELSGNSRGRRHITAAQIFAHGRPQHVIKNAQIERSGFHLRRSNAEVSLAAWS